MSITVRKATEADIAKLKNNPTWGCEVSEFDWHYDTGEICLDCFNSHKSSCQ